VVAYAHFLVAWMIVVVAAVVELLLQMHFLNEVEVDVNPVRNNPQNPQQRVVCPKIPKYSDLG